MKRFGNINILLGLSLLILGQNVSGQSTFIQVEGPQANALKLLKAGGFKAKDAVPQKFLLPTVTIGGNIGPVDYGEMVILTADYDVDHIPDGLVELKFNWTVLDDGKQKKVFIADGGKEIAFAVGMRPKRIVVMLDVNCLFETKQTLKVLGDDGKTATDKVVITEANALSPTPILSEIIVGAGPSPLPLPLPNPLPTPGPAPAPSPTPIPPSPPIPVLPDGQFGLAPFAYQIFTADTNIDATSKKNLATALANNLEGIAARIAAIADYKDMATILADTKIGNDSAFASTQMDVSRTVALKEAIRKKIYDLYHTQKINTAADISTAWRELSQGLRAVR